MRRNVLTLILLVLCSFAFVKGILHLRVQPSYVSYGILFGRELPPYKVLKPEGLPNDPCGVGRDMNGRKF